MDVFGRRIFLFKICYVLFLLLWHLIMGDMPGFTLIERLEKTLTPKKEMKSLNLINMIIYYIIKRKLNEDNYGFYIKHLFEFEDDLFLLFNTFELCKFLFSILVTCDSYATHMFKNGYDISELNLVILI